MNLHTESKFEDEICNHFAAHDWFYAEEDAASYDRQLALFHADILAWVQETQTDAWDVLTENHGARCRISTVVQQSYNNTNQEFGNYRFATRSTSSRAIGSAGATPSGGVRQVG